jgi:hypothetical protein
MENNEFDINFVFVTFKNLVLHWQRKHWLSIDNVRGFQKIIYIYSDDSTKHTNVPIG